MTHPPFDRRRYVIMLDKRLEEFPYVTIHVSETDGALPFIDSSEIMGFDRLMLEELRIYIEDGVTIYNGTTLYRNTAIYKGSILNANCVICPGVTIAPGSYVDKARVMVINPPDRFTIWLRTVAWFLARFRRFWPFKKRADKSIGSVS